MYEEQKEILNSILEEQRQQLRDCERNAETETDYGTKEFFTGYQRQLNQNIEGLEALFKSPNQEFLQLPYLAGQPGITPENPFNPAPGALKPRPGLVLADTYRLEKVLGKGGMGEVWLATHLLLNEPRAIKLILDARAADTPSRERFIREEARHALRLIHPNVVRVHDLGQQQQTPYIVMEYISSGGEGSDLKTLLKARGRLTPGETARLLDQIAAGLEAAHKLGLVHCDLKPANILITPSGDAKISDFGLVRDLSATRGQASSGVMGTPLYMSPEQLRGEVSTRSDIYSLGVILYELLLGRPPFTGSSRAVRLQHVTLAPADPHLIDPHIPLTVSKVILKALAKNPEERYSNASDFARAFRAAIEGTDSKATQVPVNLKPLQTSFRTPPPQNYWQGTGQPAGWGNQNPQSMTPGSSWSSRQNTPYFQMGEMPSATLNTAQRRSNRRAGLFFTLLTIGVVVGVIAVIIFSLAANFGQAPRPTPVVLAGDSTSPASTTVPLIVTETPAPTANPTISVSVTGSPTPSPGAIIPVGVTNSPTPIASTTIPTGNAGSPVSMDGYSVLVNQVEKAESYQGQTAEAGNQFVFVDVTYTSGEDNANIAQIMFFNRPRLMDNQGYVYEPDSITQGLRKPALGDNNAKLSKGNKARGWVTFEIPKTAQGLLLSFPFREGLMDRFNNATSRVPIKLDDQVSPTPPSFGPVTGTSGKVGQVVGQGQTLLLVNSVLITDQLKRQDGTVRKASDGKKFVALNVTMGSTSSRGAYIHFNNASLKDADNFSYAVTRGVYPPELPVMTDLPKDFKVQGWLCFEVPAGASGLRFEYNSDVGGQVNLKVELGDSSTP